MAERKVKLTDGKISVSGPYHYPHDLHDSYRIDDENRIIASVYAADGDHDKAQGIAELIRAALSAEKTRGDDAGSWLGCSKQPLRSR